MSERVRRFDRVEQLKPPTKLDNGFLRVEGRIARVGIQEYRDAKGGIRRELRLPEEVFNEDSLNSFRLLPITNDHPPVMLTADNATKYAVGALGEPRKDGDYITSEMLLHDSKAIADALAGKNQLSNGYTAELDDTQDEAITKKWGKYDAIQRGIRGNHCALVSMARAGVEARLRLDGTDAECASFAVPNESMLVSTQSPTEEIQPMPHSLVIDGMKFETADANAQAQHDRYVDRIRKDAERATADVQAKFDALAKEMADAKAALSALQAKHDTLTEKQKADADKMVKCDECSGKGKIDGNGECKNCEGKGEYAAKTDTAEKRKDSLGRIIARGVKSRAALVVIARKHLGENEKLDDLDDIEIKRRVVKKLNPAANLDGKDEIYVQARFDGCLETAPTHIDQARANATARAVHRDDEAPTNPEDARQKMIERQRENERNAAKRN